MVILALPLAAPLWAKPVIYPAKGQSAEQQQKDDGECYGWAKANTGIDPAAVASQPPPPSAPAAGGGERVRGAARGAVGGAAIGAIAGGGKGAAIGAAVGGGAGGATVLATRGQEIKFPAEHRFSFSLRSEVKVQSR